MYYLEYFPNARGDAIRHLHEEKQRWINQPKKGFLRYQGPLASINHIKAKWHDFSGDIVQIGKPEELTSGNRQQVLEVMQKQMVEILPGLAGKTIELDATFDELGFNSMEQAEILVKALESLALSTPLVDFAPAKTIGEMAEQLAQKSELSQESDGE